MFKTSRKSKSLARERNFLIVYKARKAHKNEDVSRGSVIFENLPCHPVAYDPP